MKGVTMLELNAEGYNLIEADNGVWYLQVVGDTAFKGTFREVYLFSIYRIGFKPEDLDEAILDMANLGHNAAHFGAFKKYIYPFTNELSVRKAA
jgi:hypothetical protein